MTDERFRQGKAEGASDDSGDALRHRQAYQFALDAMRASEWERHPDLPPEELAWRVTRRMQGDPTLGR
jgi:hypothetical protein